MSNYPCVPVLEVINVLSYKLLHLLQIMLFCSILQQNNHFLEKATLLSQFGMSNYPCVPILEVINVLSYKLLHLLQIELFCSILQQTNHFLEKATLLI